MQFCTALGAAIVPFSYITVWEMTESLTAAGLAAAFIIFGKYLSVIIE